MERFVAELGGNFKVKVDSGEVRCREGKQDIFFFADTNNLQADEPQTPKEKGRYVNVPVPGSSEVTHVDGNDVTAGHCVRRARFGQVLEALD